MTSEQEYKENRGEQYDEYSDVAQEALARVDPRLLKDYYHLDAAIKAVVDFTVQDQFDQSGSQYQRLYTREEYRHLVTLMLQFNTITFDALAKEDGFTMVVDSLAELKAVYLEGRNPNALEMRCLATDGGVLIVGVGAFGGEGGAPGSFTRLHDPKGVELQALRTREENYLHGWQVDGGLKVIQYDDHHIDIDPRTQRARKDIHGNYIGYYPWSVEEVRALHTDPRKAMKVDIPYGARVIYESPKGDFDGAYLTIRKLRVKYSPNLGRDGSIMATRAGTIAVNAGMTVAAKRADSTVRGK